MDQAPQQQLDLNKYKSIWSRRKWLAIAVILIGMPLTGLVWFIVPSTYQAVAELKIGPTKAEKDVGGASARGDQTKAALRKIDEVKGTLTSYRVIRKLIEDPSVRIKGLAGDIDVDDVNVDNLYRLLKGRIGFHSVGTEILQVSYSHRKPGVAEAFVKGLISESKAEWADKSQEEYEYPYRRRAEEVKAARDTLDDKRQELMTFRKNHASQLAKGDLKALGDRLTEVTDRLNKINWDLKAGKQELVFLRAELQRTEQKIEMPGSSLLMTKKRKLNEAIAGLEITLIGMEAKYHDGHQDIKIVKKQIASLRKERENTEGKEVEPTSETLPDNPIYLEYRRRVMERELDNQKLEEERASKKKEEQTLQNDIRDLPDILKVKSIHEDSIKEWQHKLTAAIIDEDKAKKRYDLAKTNEIETIKDYQPVYVLTVGNIKTKIMLTAAVGAATIVAALFLMWLAEQLKPSLVLVDVEDAREFLRIPSLGIVPVIETLGDAKRRYLWKAVPGVAIAIELAALCLVFSVFRETVDAWVGASWIGSIAGDILMRLVI